MLVVLISGRGSNLQALLDAGLPVAAVISNDPAAGGLRLAAERGVATGVVDHRSFASRDAFDAALAKAIDRYAPRLVALAGFMRILTPAFVQRYEGRMLNIHPSLLPAFPGLDTHARALAAGVKLHGCTVHFVTAQLDHGPIVIQGALRVRSGEDERALAARVLKLEHVAYPRAARWFIDGRLSIAEGIVRVEGADQHEQLVLSAD
ncbi:MAG TPA: phosphoribosylglycinamide formyltransferase [Burkholderiales bacterium]|nr:phosphoribosylglycinamide formyltransferase [Burkholderiales bacterium]